MDYKEAKQTIIDVMIGALFFYLVGIVVGLFIILLTGCGDSDRRSYYDYSARSVTYIVDACNELEPGEEIELDDGTIVRNDGNDCIVRAD